MRTVQLCSHELGNFNWIVTKCTNFSMKPPALIFRKAEPYPFTLKMEAAGSSETPVSIY
jgi:hypothetical protein